MNNIKMSATGVTHIVVFPPVLEGPQTPGILFAIGRRHDDSITKKKRLLKEKRFKNVSDPLAEELICACAVAAYEF